MKIYLILLTVILNACQSKLQDKTKNNSNSSVKDQKVESGERKLEESIKYALPKNKLHVAVCIKEFYDLRQTEIIPELKNNKIRYYDYNYDTIIYSTKIVFPFIVLEVKIEMQLTKDLLRNLIVCTTI